MTTEVMRYRTDTGCETGLLVKVGRTRAHFITAWGKHLSVPKAEQRYMTPLNHPTVRQAAKEIRRSPGITKTSRALMRGL